MVGWGERRRTQLEIVQLFREQHLDLPLISQGTVSKIEAQFREVGHVKPLRKEPKFVDEDVKLPFNYQVRGMLAGRQSGMSTRLAEHTYNIPRRTIINKLKGRHVNKPGFPAIFTYEEERCISDKCSGVSSIEYQPDSVGIVDKSFLSNQQVVIVEDVVSKFRELVSDKLGQPNINVSFQSSLKCHGFVVDREGLRTDPDKVSATLNFPTPRTTTEVKRVNGLVSYYRRFISNYAELSAPIISLIKGKMKQIRLFKKLRDVLVLPQSWYLPTSIRVFISKLILVKLALGAVFFQKVGDGEHPVAYVSRTLTSAERKYSATYRELLGVIFDIEHFRGYAEGIPFTVITDCAALKWLHHIGGPTGRLARW
ncbi:hypothetical protein ILUMI_13186 [Ignelater luminosus]|uniref:Reverse transcriptase RNase H-like domain-containing protein n=1 Tax=Ignelater luminosus TaxID=2038154 RepID=A0A8K0CSR1_IGNLU|nr:hypothetical protein ILUMI_13186 [Ignelater luminosus]